MSQIAKIIRMDNEGECVLVQSVEPKDQFQRGGSMHGYRYEWGVNHYSFTEHKENVMERLGLTEAEWDYWDAQFVARFSWEKDEWYFDNSIKTFTTLGA